jgi:hypothetical protein
MLAVDAIFTVIWLSAFAAQAAYNSAGDCGKVCRLSGAVVGLGVVITYVLSLPSNRSHGSGTNVASIRILFAITTFLSAYTLTYYNFHGNLPGYDSRKIRTGDNIDPDKAAFSMAPHDDDAYAPVHMDDHDGPGAGSSAYGGAGAYSDNGGGNQYGSANPYSADDYDDPNRYGTRPPRGNAMFDSDLEYNAGSSQPPRVSSPYGGAGSDPYDEPAKFPAANYDRTIR